jgi:addiction module HigA family antidote
MRLRRPSHPGEALAEIVFPAVNVSRQRIAQNLGISRQYLHKIMTGKAPISADIALRLERAIGGDAETWMNMQTAHDLWRREQELFSQLESTEKFESVV